MLRPDAKNPFLREVWARGDFPCGAVLLGYVADLGISVTFAHPGINLGPHSLVVALSEPISCAIAFLQPLLCLQGDKPAGHFVAFDDVALLDIRGAIVGGKRALLGLIGLPIEPICDEVVEAVSDRMAPMQEKSPKNAS